MAVSAAFAYKDLRRQPARSLLLIAAFVLSISAVSGVRGFSTAALAALQGDSRASLTGDLCADTNQPLADEQFAALDALQKDGVQWTLATMILTMVSSDESPEAVFATVKAVDPAAYPLYGEHRLDLGGDRVIVSESTLRRLRVRPGDRILIAGQPFHIAAAGPPEPEQILGILDRGLRLTLSRANFDKLGLIRRGTSVRNRILLRIPPSFDLRAAKQTLQELFPDAMVFDYKDVNRNLGVRLEPVAMFFSETALVSFAFGLLGVAIAVRQRLAQQLDLYAVMKTLGARNAQLIALFASEIALLAAAALPIGAALGWVVKNILLSLLARNIAFPRASSGNGTVALEAVGAALLAILPVIAEPVRMLRALRPAVLLRREASPVPESGKCVVRSTLVLLVAGFGVVSFHLLGALFPAVAFTATLLISVLLIVVLTRLALWIAASIRPREAALRIACGNLVRPGNGAAMLIATLSAGVMMMTGTVASRHVVFQAIEARLPFDLENSVALTGFDNAYRESIVKFAAALPGVERLETKSEARLRLTSADDGLYIAACGQGLAINREMADRLGAQIGTRLNFFAGTRELAATVSTISPFNRQMEVDCSPIDPKDLLYQDVVQARRGRLPEVEASIRGRFPALAVINSTELSAVVAGLSRDAQRLAACVAGYSLAVGLAILMTLVASSRRRRLREIAVLSTLGATPRLLARIHTIEFAATGAIAGFIGTAMACGFSSLLLGLIFHRWELSVEWPTAFGAILLSAILTTASGWLPTYRLLRQKPAIILRGH